MWLTRKAKYIIAQDKQRKRACVVNATYRQYKELIHNVVLQQGQYDKFSGDKLNWSLVCTWDDSLTKSADQALIAKYSILPTVDHVDPQGAFPQFEICSWLVNRCKSELTPIEFVAQCNKIISYQNSKNFCNRSL